MSVQVFPDDTARVRRDDPASSHEAADATAWIVAASQAAVASVFRDDALTAPEVEARMYAAGFVYSPSRIRSCLPELETAGVLVRDGYIRRTGDTRRRQVWKHT